VVDAVADLAPTLTPYRYCYNNPTNYTDPTGMFEYGVVYQNGSAGFDEIVKQFGIGSNLPKNKGLDVSDLENGDPAGFNALIGDLEQKTGLTLSTENGYLQYKDEVKSGNEGKKTSKKAREMLIKAITANATVRVLNNHKQSKSKSDYTFVEII
jgi:hypothetical protein